jgi:TetR/AcrR family transcriptional regulator, transcriptional repressor for nem operon
MGLFLSKILIKMARTKAFEEAVALEKAMQIFWKKGFNATSMEDLVTAMGINRASLYDTFGDKKRLYLAALGQFSTESSRENTVVATQCGDCPRQKIEAIFRNSLAQAIHDPEQKGCMLANATAEMAILDTDVMRFTKNSLENMETWFADLIRAGQKTGSIRADLPPESTATFLINYVHGMRIVCKTRPDAEKMRESLNLALSLLK